MADQKISQLTEVTNPNSNDVIPIVNGGSTKKITVSNLVVAGSSGTSGTSGVNGTSGSSGTSGSNGSNGSSGSSGSNGSSGTSGVNGTNGSSGTSGSNGSSGTSGSNGSSGTSGNTGSSGTSGTSGYVDNDWLFFTPSTSTIPSTGNNFVLSGTTTSNGSVSYNQSTGIITLAANKTYKLDASLALANSASNAELNYNWINVTNSNTTIGNTGALLVSNSTAQAAWQPVASAIITTTGTTQIALRVDFTNSTGGLNVGMCRFIVNQINGWSGSSGTSGSNGSSGTSGSAGTSGSSGTSPVNVLLKTTGTWTLPTGSTIQSFTVDTNSSYSMWVNGNIPFGIINWNATATLSNTNVPVVGAQYGWYYATGNALVLTSMPDQFVGTNGSILNSPSTYSLNTSNVFNFGITNNSGTPQTISYGYIKLS